MRYRTPFLALLALAGLLVYSTGCDSASNPVAPTGSVLTVTANPTFVGLSGSSTITISGFKPDGNPLNPGTLINLSTSQGSIPSVVTADSTGRATATFTADERVGTATVTASLPGNEATAMASVEIGEQRPVLEISANPETIDVGVGTSTVTVIARDFNGFVLPDDGPIILTATNGTLNRTSIRTNGSGIARATFTAGEDASGDGVVNALLRNSETVSVTITIRDAPNGISLTADPSAINRADGVVVTLTAFVFNAQGDPVGSELVRFSSENNIGRFDSDQVATTGGGQAVARLTVNIADLTTIPTDGTGSFVVTATVGSEGAVEPATATITVNN